MGVRHVLKRVTRRDQVFRLHTVAELLPCMAWKRQCPLPLVLVCRLMCSLRVLSGFPRVEVRMRVAAFGLRSESISLACGPPAVRGAWWAASLETRCLGHRLTALEALGCVMHALP